MQGFLYLYYCSGVGSGSGSGAGGSVSVTGSVTVSVAVSVFVDTSVVSLGCVKDGVVSVAFFVSVEAEVVVVVFEVVVVVLYGRSADGLQCDSRGRRQSL